MTLQNVYAKRQSLLMAYYKDQKSVLKKNLARYQEMNYMKKEDEFLKEMFKFIDVEIEPPAGTKQRIYERLFYGSNQWSCYYLPCLSWFSKKFLKLAIQIWISICIFMTIFSPTIAL